MKICLINKYEYIKFKTYKNNNNSYVNYGKKINDISLKDRWKC